MKKFFQWFYYQFNPPKKAEDKIKIYKKGDGTFICKVFASHYDYTCFPFSKGWRNVYCAHREARGEKIYSVKEAYQAGLDYWKQKEEKEKNEKIEEIKNEELALLL